MAKAIQTKPGWLCVGAIAGAKGLQGEVRIKTFTADPTDVQAYGPVSDKDEKRKFRLKVKGMAKGMVVAKLEGVNDRTAAESLKGVALYVPRTALPKAEDGEFYHADLLGLRAELSDGTALGTVKEVHDYGAGTSLEIVGETVEGKANVVMVPFTMAAVPEVDLTGGKVVVEPLPGLLETPKQQPEEA